MKLYLVRRNSCVNAQAEYDIENKKFVVLKGSSVSEKISTSECTKCANSIKRQRSNGIVKNHRLTQDVEFKSPSTAANFVTGTSTNGMIAWKNEKGEMLRSILAKEE